MDGGSAEPVPGQGTRPDPPWQNESVSEPKTESKTASENRRDRRPYFRDAQANRPTESGFRKCEGGPVYPRRCEEKCARIAALQHFEGDSNLRSRSRVISFPSPCGPLRVADSHLNWILVETCKRFAILALSFEYWIRSC